jgi:hypothetical protein
MLPDRRHDSSGFERDDAEDSSPFGVRRSSSAMLGSWATGALGMVPSASEPHAQVRPLVTRKSRVGPSVLVSRSLGGAPRYG